MHRYVQALFWSAVVAESTVMKQYRMKLQKRDLNAYYSQLKLHILTTGKEDELVTTDEPAQDAEGLRCRQQPSLSCATKGQA